MCIASLAYASSSCFNKPIIAHMYIIDINLQFSTVNIAENGKPVNLDYRL